MADDTGVRFFCRECGYDVWRALPFGDEEDELCFECKYILSIPDPRAREEIRAHLRKARDG